MIIKKYFPGLLVILIFLLIPALAQANEGLTAANEFDNLLPEDRVDSPFEIDNLFPEDRVDFAMSEALPVGDILIADQAGDKATEEVASVNTGDNAGNLDEGGEAEEVKPIADPLEPWNRLVFSFNDKVYFWLLKPAAQVYSAVVPEWVRIRVRNIFNNITAPVRLVNALLQFDTKAVGVELTRFIVNSTFGLGGMFDIAGESPNLKSTDKDMGQTLGVYGLGDGFFMIWPVLGPSSLRDSAGMAGDYWLNPVNYLSPLETVLAVHSYKHVNNTSLMIGEYEDFKESAIDPYVSMRDAYMQHRRSKVKEYISDFSK